jgi:hypothetical protein
MPKDADAPAAPSLETFSIRIPPELFDRLRNASFWTPGSTLVSIGERALERELDRMEKANGGPFKPRTNPNLRGRRLS